jgi:preprotein translocase subunit SecF
MLNLILIQTPKWVWLLLAALLWLGLSQTVSRTASMKRITLMPLAMIGLSIFGTLSVFGTSLTIVLAWLGSGAVVLALILRKTSSAAIKYDAGKRLFSLPGSWVPLVLILGIFITKYIVGFMTAMQPSLAQDANFALFFTTLSGAFSGVFLARAVGLWRVAFQAEKSLASGLIRV